MECNDTDDIIPFCLYLMNKLRWIVFILFIYFFCISNTIKKINSPCLNVTGFNLIVIGVNVFHLN